MGRISLMVSSLAVLAAALPVQAAQAQESGAARLAALPLDQLCRRDGSLDMAFGGTGHGVASSHQAGNINRLAGPELAPFAGIAVNATKYSNRLFSVEFSGTVGDKAATRVAVAQLAARFAAAGWIKSKRSPDEDGPMVDLPVEQGDALFYSADGVEASSTNFGVRLAIQATLGELYLTCEHTGELRKQLKEALGEMPPGLPRPQFVPAAPALRAELADCLDPARRKTIMKALMEGAMRPAGYDRLDYEERLADWKIMTLVSSGKVSRDVLTEKIIGLIDGPESVQTMEAGLDMLKDLEPMMAAGKKNDEAGMCRTLIGMMHKGEAASRPVVGAVGDAVTPQWRATHALLDAEAKRLAITFEQ
jgi:hypothetical protein